MRTDIRRGKIDSNSLWPDHGPMSAASEPEEHACIRAMVSWYDMNYESLTVHQPQWPLARGGGIDTLQWQWWWRGVNDKVDDDTGDNSPRMTTMAENSFLLFSRSRSPRHRGARGSFPLPLLSTALGPDPSDLWPLLIFETISACIYGHNQELNKLHCGRDPDNFERSYSQKQFDFWPL